jgi:hypothetical protein
MSDLGDTFRAMRADQKIRRSARLVKRTEEIYDLRDLGYIVTALTEYQFRIRRAGRAMSSEAVDLYPIHNRFHNINTGGRGTYRHLRSWLERYFPSELMKPPKVSA